MDLRSKIILIYGPTASGKSQFAIELAKKINGEIINADSMQIYKELKILSARPFKKDIKNIRHHLYGFQTVKKNFSTGDWLKLANQKISILKKKKKIPILVGGTGLYFKALVDGLVDIPKIPIKYRNEIRALHKKIGSKKFFSNISYQPLALMPEGYPIKPNKYRPPFNAIKNKAIPKINFTFLFTFLFLIKLRSVISRTNLSIEI